MASKPSKDLIEDLVDREVDWDSLKNLLTTPKSRQRFSTYVEVLQERVPWDDPILLPYAEHLFVVINDRDEWVIKCDCGHEFCHYEQNWKEHSNIYVRDTDEEIQELYPEELAADSDWQELREYFCPNCNTLLDVEAVMPWYPPVHSFVPDIETFYNEWLDQPLPTRE